MSSVPQARTGQEPVHTVLGTGLGTRRGLEKNATYSGSTNWPPHPAPAQAVQTKSFASPTRRTLRPR